MKLIVAEKPSVGNTIANVLGIQEKKNGYIDCDNGYVVSWCQGHLAELYSPDDYGEQYSEKWRFEQLPIIPAQWKLKSKPSAYKQFEIVKSLMNRGDITEIVCATDAGREGEVIFRYVYLLCGCKTPVKRLWTSSLEESAIRQALDNLKDSSFYDNLYAAGYARAKADWLVGMNASRLFTLRYGQTLTIGRVQTPTLAMIVERNNKVKNFVKEKFYTVDIDCGNGLVASSERIASFDEASSLKNSTDGQKFTVVSKVSEHKNSNPPKLYDLTSLQRDANRLFGYTAAQTLDYLQSLYEKKLATYPRTDSKYITEDMAQSTLSLIDDIYTIFPALASVKSAPPNINQCVNSSKVSDHPAVLPTALISTYDLNSLPGYEQDILLLVCIRLLCAAGQPQKYESTTVELQSNVNNTVFTAKGKRIISDGWKSYSKAVETEKKQPEEKTLPPVDEGQTFTASSSITEHFTAPPKQFTDASLLSAMETAGTEEYVDDDVEKKGLGTTATRAETIEGLLQKEYIKREKKLILPTERGIALIDCVPAEVKSPKMTAEWETQLQKIERGESSDIDFLQGIENYVRSLVSEYSSVDSSKAMPSRYSVIGICPRCGKRLLSFPKSYSCESGKDGCGFVIWKKIASKNITENQVKMLLEKGYTNTISGFVSNKTGKTYSAKLKLNNGKVEFDFSDGKKVGNNNRRWR